MKTRILVFVDHVRASYWFVPAVMALIAVVSSAAAIEIDVRLGDRWVYDFGWLSWNGPEGARLLLSTVAGSMIGVAGVTFSITIVSVVYASGQYGPRVLRNFMSDVGNQVTLGTFIATFLYCLLILRVVRVSPDFGDQSSAGAFVPHVGVSLALVLAVASICVLIYFIHHVPQSIHVSNLIAEIGRELRACIGVVFPVRIGEGAETPTDDLEEPTLEDGSVVEVAASETGYIESIDADGLMQVAMENDLLLRIVLRPGDFVSAGDTLIEASPRERVGEGTHTRISRAFCVGALRTSLQDVRFLADELVEIAVRALSPGINDPFTAIGCVNWLTSGFKILAEREEVNTRRVDDEGKVRVIAEATTFEMFLCDTIRVLAPHARSEDSVARHLECSLRSLFDRTDDPGRRDAINRAIAMLDGESESRHED